MLTEFAYNFFTTTQLVPLRFGTHTPAMLAETIRALVSPDPDGTYVDGTFGRGGHTRGILASLGPNGRLHAFDMDPEVRRRFIFIFFPPFFHPLFSTPTRPFPPLPHEMR
jgi:hypothetical protein